jgi:uncharacterized protein
MSVFAVDAFEFCRLKERREGRVVVADFVRLSAECADQSGILEWSVEGGVSALGHSQLILSVSGVVQLVCQRCLTSFPFDITSQSTLVVAKDDQSADEIEELVGDDAVDVVVLGKSVDLLTLIEDEALLAIPLSPKHDVCPDLAVKDVLEAAKGSPFSALKNLKQ